MKKTEDTPLIINPKPNPHNEFSEFVELIILPLSGIDRPLVKPPKHEPASIFCPNNT